MKTKTFLFVCLFIGFGLTQLSAQNGKNGTGTFTTKLHIENNFYDISIVCDGVEVDIVNFPLSFDIRYSEHYKKGEFIWYKSIASNQLYTSK